MELNELCNLYPRGHPRLENELNQLKRKLGVDDQLFNSSDDDDLCVELDSVERKCKKLKLSFKITRFVVSLSLWENV